MTYDTKSEYITTKPDRVYWMKANKIYRFWRSIHGNLAQVKTTMLWMPRSKALLCPLRRVARFGLIRLVRYQRKI